MKTAFFRRAELLSILIALLTLLCIGAFSAVDWMDYRRDRSEVLAARHINEHATALLLALIDAETGQRGFVLTGDTAYLKPYSRSLAAIRRELDVLDTAAARDDSVGEQIRRLRASTASKLDEMARTIDLRKQGNEGQSVDLVMTGAGKALMDSIRQLTGQIREEETSLSDTRSLVVRARSERAHLIALVSSAVLLIILALGAWNIHHAGARREQLIGHLAEITAVLDKAQGMIQQLDGTILFWNSGAEALYGWPREEAIGRKDHELLQTEFQRPLDEIQAELLEQGRWSGECRQKRRDGSIIWVASYVALHRDAAGKPVSVVKVNNDITELKRATEALQTSEATTRSLFENASEGILTADREGRIVDANAMTERLFGYSRAELIGASVETLLPEWLRGRHIGHRASFNREPHSRPMGQGIDLIALRKDGSVFPVEVSLSYIADRSGGGLDVAFVSDITARKKADRERDRLVTRLEDALSEKITLLKEVHHRVKNNLAVIAALLGMQADAIADGRAHVALTESQQRVSSMALIHEHLYATENLDRVNFAHYVRQLAQDLSIAYGTQPDLVEFGIEAEEIELAVNQAIPCGLILNELLSNAIKYAFPNGRKGKIDVRFGRLESGDLLLSCGDDGIGMQRSFDWQNSNSLGLRICTILTKQIDGALTLDRDGAGTRFEVRFPSAHPES